MMIGLTIGIILAVMFMCLYIAAIQENAELKKYQESQKARCEEEQAQQEIVPEVRDDDRILDKDTLMEAIRANGLDPKADDNFVLFNPGGRELIIDSDRLPVMVIEKVFKLDMDDFNIEALRRAAFRVSKDIVVGKVQLKGDNQEWLSIAVEAVEKKYGHFRDTLKDYISIIETCQSHLKELYDKSIGMIDFDGKGLPHYARNWEA